MPIDAPIRAAFVTVSVGILGAACAGSQSGTTIQQPAGDPALVVPVPSVYGITVQRVGTTMGMQYAPIVTLRNRGSVVLERVAITGRGVGTAIRIVRIEVVPTLNGTHSIPQSSYSTDPPVQLISGVCHKAVLRPLNGYRIAPGGWVRLFVIYRTVEQGAWRAPSVAVTYENRGTSHTQSLPYTLEGSVSNSARRATLPRQERACLSHTTLLSS